ncbi:type 1 glutamine amidotransferase domain-containing protein [Streptomyces sp. NPDC058441]|uniref:type 1 glutamine amidotransferase domain-containing protein n=1 Tax=Streptomyces sp. NPDC058441 TaxID=3346502 RepID=UPI00366529D8
MARVLFAVTGSRYWTLKDGTKHPCGYWPEELAVPHQVFDEAGLEVTIATPGAVVPVADEAGFTAAMNGDSEEPGIRFRGYLDSISGALSHPADLDTVDAADHDFVFVPGGHGPMEDLASSEPFGRLLGAFTAAGKPVAAVCHGPAALLPAVDAEGWIFRGRRMTGFTNEEETQVGFADKAAWLLEDHLTAVGSIFESGPGPWQPHLVVDGNLYTGQNPASSRPLAEALVAAVAAVQH